MISSREKKGYVQLVIYSILVGSVGIVVRLIEGMNAFSIVFFRAFLGVLFVFLIVLFRRKLSELKLKCHWRTLLVGVFQGLSIVLYFLAIMKTSIANAVFLLYTAPLFSLIFARVFFKEKIDHKTWWGVVFVMGGILLIFDPICLSFSCENSMGNLMALGSGFFYAAMGMVSKSLREEVSANYVVFWQYLIIAAGLFFLVDKANWLAVPMNLGSLLYLGIFACGIAFLLFMKGIAKVKAQKVFVITSLEPIVGGLLGMVFFQEMPTFLAGLGFVFVFFGVFLVMKQRSQ